MNELVIISLPEKKKFVIVRTVDPGDQILILGNLVVNAVLVSYANTYEEADQIVKNLNGD